MTLWRHRLLVGRRRGCRIYFGILIVLKYQGYTLELKTFIKEALKDIIEAVEEAQSEIKSGEIAPNVGSSFKSIELGINDIQPVEFEVTIDANEQEGSSAKLNVVAAFIGGNIQGQSNSASSHAAKLKFNIPVRLPKPNKK